MNNLEFLKAGAITAQRVLENVSHVIMADAPTSTTSVFNNGTKVIQDNIAPLAIFVFVIGGVLWMIPLRAAKEFAKEHMLQTIIGLILISSAAAIIGAFYIN